MLYKVDLSKGWNHFPVLFFDDKLFLDDLSTVELGNPIYDFQGFIWPTPKDQVSWRFGNQLLSRKKEIKLNTTSVQKYASSSYKSNPLRYSSILNVDILR